MATSRLCVKCFKNTCEIDFSCMYMLFEIPHLVYEISRFLEVLYKKGVLKNFLKFTGDYKKQPSGRVLSKRCS